MKHSRQVSTAIAEPRTRQEGSGVFRVGALHEELLVLGGGPGRGRVRGTSTRNARSRKAQRQEEAFGRLYTGLGPRLKAYFMKAGCSPELAEDLLHDVLLSVWRRADMYDPDKGQVKTWVFAIARNRLIDRMRRNRPVPRPEDLAWAPSAPPSPDQAAASEQRRDSLRASLEHLPEEQRMVLEATYVQGMTLAEHAAELRLPLGTIKSRARLALKKLREPAPTASDRPRAIPLEHFKEAAE